MSINKQGGKIGKKNTKTSVGQKSIWKFFTNSEFYFTS